MKNYTKPMLNIENIELTDIILESGNGEINAGKLWDDMIVFPGSHNPNN